MPSRAKAATASDFDEAFAALRKLVKPYEKKLSVKTDEPGNYMSETKSPSFKGKPMMFAAIMSKSYVAFHFFPVYLFPELLNGTSLDLKKRMQGKTCWNFKKAEPELFAELGRVVQAGFERFETNRYL